jgi:two-component sensor histidine kinase
LDSIDKKYPQSADPVTVLQQTRVRLRISRQLNKLDEVEYYCKKLADLVDANNFDNLNKHAAYNAIISGYMQLKRFPQVRSYLVKQEQVLGRIPFSNRNAAFHRQWFMLDSATGNYKSAIDHLLDYNKANDSIFNQTKAQQIQQLEVEYQTAEQSKNIELLNQEKKAQQAELKQTALIKNIIIAAAALLLVILFLLYNQFRIKQDSNIIIQNKNAVLEHIVNEKEWLLKEVHHRVKNNLQTVVSLLELQSENLRDEALSAIQDSQNRIYAMSLIHKKLYQTDNIASINMQPYLLELTAHLQTVYNPDRKISFDLHLTSVELDVSQAIPVGLIVNEAVTNSVKYAFKDGEQHPQISILLNQNLNHDITLTISDNGIGLPPGFDSAASAGLGFKLINGLVDDIAGRLSVYSDQGTVIRIVFKASVPFEDRVERSRPSKAVAI